MSDLDIAIETPSADIHVAVDTTSDVIVAAMDVGPAGPTGPAGPLATVNAGIEFALDGGGFAITTGVKGFIEVPFACTITEVTLLADTVGSIVVDIWRVPFASFPGSVANSICGTGLPTLSAVQRSQDTNLVAEGWTTSLALGDLLTFNVNSVSTVQRVTLSLRVTRS